MNPLKFLSFKKKCDAAPPPCDHPDPHFRFPKGMIRDDPSAARVVPPAQRQFEVQVVPGYQHIALSTSMPRLDGPAWSERLP
jgi:hypothetical protein